MGEYVKIKASENPYSHIFYLVEGRPHVKLIST